MIKNVYSKQDYVLLMYSCSERDHAIGRNPVFSQMKQGRNFENDKGEEPVIVEEGFWLRNYDL